MPAWVHYGTTLVLLFIFVVWLVAGDNAPGQNTDNDNNAPKNPGAVRRKRIIERRRQALIARRAWLRSRVKPTTPPPTLAPPPRYPGENLNLSSSCDTCRVICTWVAVTRLRYPAEAACLQLGAREDEVQHGPLAECANSMCTDLFGKSMLALVRCQNFLHSNRASLTDLLAWEPTGLDMTSGIIVDMGEKMKNMCTQLLMCPPDDLSLGRLKASASSAALLPANCDGFRVIVDKLAEKVRAAPDQGHQISFLGKTRAWLLYHPYLVCNCHFDVMLRACVDSFHHANEAGMLYRCLDLVQLDAKQEHSCLCEGFCEVQVNATRLGAMFGQCIEDLHPSHLF